MSLKQGKNSLNDIYVTKVFGSEKVLNKHKNKSYLKADLKWS